jgi:hypothetical protein
VGNWRQVQARISKARTGPDAPAKLAELFEKTRDAMVAFELARVHEEGQRGAEAIEWYRKAHGGFRREDWRRKSAEAIVRLGGEPVSEAAVSSDGDSSPATPKPPATSRGATGGLPDRLFHDAEEAPHPATAEAAPPGEQEDMETVLRESTTEAAGAGATPAADALAGGKRRRRRGRRGGRRHRKGGELPKAAAPHAAPPVVEQETVAPPVRAAAPPARPPAPPRSTAEAEAEAGWLGARAEEMRTRAGDPGLASRVARMEMQVRRLLACPPQKLSDADLAPAGPGVILLSDSDLTTHYYITSCATLRIEISRLGRAERGSRSAAKQPELRSRLADHLEINESQVGKYLAQHCAVRWLQLDEGAPRVAHFAIGVLEPILND